MKELMKSVNTYNANYLDVSNQPGKIKHHSTYYLYTNGDVIYIASLVGEQGSSL